MKPVEVSVRRSGRIFEAAAAFDAAASIELVWTTLTDYVALPRFMPGIKACRIVERERLAPARERLLLEQKGEFRFLLFSQRMTVHLEVLQERHRLAQARALRFDLGLLKGRGLEAFEGCYELQRQRRGVRISYRARIVSRFAPPPGIGTTAVRANVARQLDALACEMERRRDACA